MLLRPFKNAGIPELELVLCMFLPLVLSASIQSGAVEPREPIPGTIQIHGHATPVSDVWFTSHGAATIGVSTVEVRDHLVGLGGDDYRVPTCTRRNAKLHTRRHWTVTYDGDDALHGALHCGQSVFSRVKGHLTCRPLTDWTCVASGKPDHGGVTVQFHTPRTCTDRKVAEAVNKGTKGRVKVACQHL